MINYSFDLTKLDDIKNSVNVKYYKDYADVKLKKECYDNELKTDELLQNLEINTVKI